MTEFYVGYLPKAPSGIALKMKVVIDFRIAVIHPQLRIDLPNLEQTQRDFWPAIISG